MLIISSGETAYWTIPKGDVQKHELLHRCAQRHALEKAGVTGRISKIPLGHYSYRRDSPWNALTVLLHLLFVENQTTNFQPQGGRQCCWLPAADASTHIREGELRELIRLVAGANTLKFISTIRKGLSTPRAMPRPSSAL